MNAEQRQTAADRGPSRRTWAIGLPVDGYETTSLFVIKADTYLTIPQRIEGWVDLDGWLV